MDYDYYIKFSSEGVFTVKIKGEEDFWVKSLKGGETTIALPGDKYKIEDLIVDHGQIVDLRLVGQSYKIAYEYDGKPFYLRHDIFTLEGRNINLRQLTIDGKAIDSKYISNRTFDYIAWKRDNAKSFYIPCLIILAIILILALNVLRK